MFLSVLMTRIAYFFNRYRRFYFDLKTSQHLYDNPNNDIGAFLSVGIFYFGIN